MWELDYKESLTPKNWCFWTVVLEKTLESPLDCKEIQPVHPKGISSWLFIGRTDAELETSILWPPDVKNWLIRKDPDDGKDWRWEEKGMMDDMMVGWHHLIEWTWVWVNSRSWWWARKPSVLQSMGSQRVGHDWATEVKWNEQPEWVWKWINPRTTTKKSGVTDTLISILWDIKQRTQLHPLRFWLTEIMK